MAQLKEDEWPEPGEETTQEKEVRLRARATADRTDTAEPQKSDLDASPREESRGARSS